MEQLATYSHHTERADFAGFILFNEDKEEVFSFGKYKGQKVTDVLTRDKGYFNWIQKADFPLYTKKVLKQIKDKMNGTGYTLDDLKKKFNG